MIFLILWTAQSLQNIQIDNDKTLIFDKSPIYVNNIKYRESINPIFFLYFKKGNYNISHSPISIINSKPIYGKCQLNDIITNNNSWTIIDNLYYYHPFDGFAQILASSSIFKNNLHFRIRKNNQILSYYYGNRFKFFEKLWFLKGDVNLFLEAKSNYNFKFYPSLNNGFYNSYQIGLWGNYTKKKNNDTHISSYEVFINNRLIYTEFLSK